MNLKLENDLMIMTLFWDVQLVGWDLRFVPSTTNNIVWGSGHILESLYASISDTSRE